MDESPMQTGYADTPDNGMSQDDGVKLCIQVAEDGGLSVYKDDGQDGERQQVSDIGQALAAVLKLYKAMDQSSDAASQFRDGYRGDGPQQPQQQRQIGGSGMMR